jgi:hypothetical protein
MWIVRPPGPDLLGENATMSRNRGRSMRRKLAVGLSALGLVFVSSGLAAASDLAVATLDADVPISSVSVEAGSDQGFTIRYTVTGNQRNPASFRANLDWTMQPDGTFVGSNPQTFNVPARAAQDPAWTDSAAAKVIVPADVPAQGPRTLTISPFELDTDSPAALDVTDGTATLAVTVTAAPPPVEAPTVDYTLDPADPDGDEGWYRSDVTLTWIITGTSPTLEGCVDQNITADQALTEYSCAATNSAGSDIKKVSIKRDATAPHNVEFVGDIAADGSYYFGQVPAAPTCTADDNLSGVALCVVTGYEDTVGTHGLTATATDNAGNQTAVTRSYTVLGWTLSNFGNPVTSGGEVENVMKGGRTVPLKFTIKAGTTELTSTTAVKSFRAVGVACVANGGVPQDILMDSETATAGNTSLRYDTVEGQFIQNWKTPKVSQDTCYRVELETQDGSKIEARFRLTK